MKWYNVELNIDEARMFECFLKDNKIAYEASGCFNLIHFEVLLNDVSLSHVCKWIDENIGE